jgi:hypothetical protein
MSLRLLPLLLVLTILTGGRSLAASQRLDLETWVAQELTPYVAGELTTHPRFRNESIRFVVFADENPQAASNKLALGIRDRLRDALAQNPGLRIVWQRDAGHAGNAGNIDCTSDQAHYYVGVEIVADRGGLLSVEIRALDVEDRSWVAGFSKSWQGYPDAIQRRQLAEQASDSSFRGMRGAPFGESEIDLLAAHLANELGCALLRQTAGEYVVAATDEVTADKAESAMLELVGNNLADFRALQFATTMEDANAVIEGKAHQVDDSLYQYWITISPIDADTAMTALTASAYVTIHDKYKTAALIPAITVPIERSNERFLDALRVIELRNIKSCPGNADYPNSRIYNNGFAISILDCYALEVDTSSDSVLFFLNHQLNNGLVRLSGPTCNSRADARIAKTGQQLHFPLPIDSLISDSWTAADGWELHPDQDSYYVVAATDTKAARALSQHIRQLPNRCSASVRKGLEGRELGAWLDEFAAIADHWKQSVDWRVIRIRNVY